MPTYVVTLAYSEKEFGKIAKEHLVDLKIEAADSMSAVEKALTTFQGTENNPHSSWQVQVDPQGINVRELDTGEMFRISEVSQASKPKEEKEKLLSMDDYLRQFESDPRRDLEIYKKALAAVLSSTSRQSALTTLVTLTAEALGTESASILLIDDTRKELYFAAAFGPAADEVKSFRVPLWEGIAGFSARTGEAISLSDVRTDQRFYKKIAENLKYETRSLIAAPVAFRGKVYGVLEGLNKTSGDVFNGSDMEMTRHLAAFAGILLAVDSKS